MFYDRYISALHLPGVAGVGHRGARTALIVVCAVMVTAVAKEPKELLTSPDAVAFGSAPTLWNVRLSPDGSMISFIQMHPQGVTIVRVLDTESGSSTMILAGVRDRFDVTWCNWANEERLLCGFRATVASFAAGGYLPISRLVAVNSDGSDREVLLQRQLRNEFAQFQDQVIDWMPDDPENVLVELPETGGSGIAELNIYTGKTKRKERAKERVYQWLTDGAGEARGYLRVTDTHRRWFVRRTPESSWQLLRSIPLTDLEDLFQPMGFGASPDELLFYGKQEGRRALFAQNLVDDQALPRLVYANDNYDVASTMTLGKYHRLAAVIYIDDRPRYHFFDERAEKVLSEVTDVFPDKRVSVFDEDWSQRYYLLSVGDERDPGTYYRYDSEKRSLGAIGVEYASLKGRELAEMETIAYPAADGTPIPAYLTLPAGKPGGKLPAVLLPHGGPSSRDYLGFDFLVQYLAARGFAVLQSNYRGSSGYGTDWEGDGAFKGWRVAIADIHAGASFLVEKNIADPDRICIVGWSYGGYAALMSIIENPETYQCAVSIAGVTDPSSLGRESKRRFVGGKSAQHFIGLSEEVVKRGSPLKRAREIQSPLLLVHPKEDINVPISQTKKLDKSLRRHDKVVQFVEYEHAEHSIRPERYRIDLLTRMGRFLDEHTYPGD